MVGVFQMRDKQSQQRRGRADGATAWSSSAGLFHSARNSAFLPPCSRLLKLTGDRAQSIRKTAGGWDERHGPPRYAYSTPLLEADPGPCVAIKTKGT
jgi:hypothetical protein